MPDDVVPPLATGPTTTTTTLHADSPYLNLIEETTDCPVTVTVGQLLRAAHPVVGMNGVPAGGFAIGRRSMQGTTFSSRVLSRNHLTLLIDRRGAVWAVDLGSLHGTAVERDVGKRIKLRPNEPFRVQETDILILGKPVTTRGGVWHAPLRVRVEYTHPPPGDADLGDLLRPVFAHSASEITPPRSSTRYPSPTRRYGIPLVYESEAEEDPMDDGSVVCIGALQPNSPIVQVDDDDDSNVGKLDIPQALSRAEVTSLRETVLSPVVPVDMNALEESDSVDLLSSERRDDDEHVTFSDYDEGIGSCHGSDCGSSDRELMDGPSSGHENEDHGDFNFDDDGEYLSERENEYDSEREIEYDSEREIEYDSERESVLVSEHGTEEDEDMSDAGSISETGSLGYSGVEEEEEKDDDDDENVERQSLGSHLSDASADSNADDSEFGTDIFPFPSLAVPLHPSTPGVCEPVGNTVIPSSVPEEDNEDENRPQCVPVDAVEAEDAPLEPLDVECCTSSTPQSPVYSPSSPSYLNFGNEDNQNEDEEHAPFEDVIVPSEIEEPRAEQWRSSRSPSCFEFCTAYTDSTVARPPDMLFSLPPSPPASSGSDGVEDESPHSPRHQIEGAELSMPPAITPKVELSSAPLTPPSPAPRLLRPSTAEASGTIDVATATDAGTTTMPSQAPASRKRKLDALVNEEAAPSAEPHNESEPPRSVRRRIADTAKVFALGAVWGAGVALGALYHIGAGEFDDY